MTGPAPWPAGGLGGCVLVLRAIGLGDALTGVPALRALRRRFPDAPVVLAAGPAIGRLLATHHIVDGYLPTRGLAPLPPMPPPALAVDLHGNGPASHHVVAGTGATRILTFARPDDGYPDGPDWRPDEHEVRRWLRLVASVGAFGGLEDLRLGARRDRDGAGPVVLHPGAAFASRRWPVDRWSALATAVAGDGRQVLLTGDAGEVALCRAVLAGVPSRLRPRVRSTAGRMDLAGLVETIGAATCLVSGDTGAAHVATATATPSVLLFGPTPPRWWGPLIDLDRHRVLWPATPGYRGDPHGAHLDPVLHAITTDEVIAAVRAPWPTAAARSDVPESIRSQEVAPR